MSSKLEDRIMNSMLLGAAYNSPAYIVHCELLVVHRAAIFTSVVLTLLWSDSHDVSQLLQKYDDRSGRRFHGTAIRLCLFALVGKENSQTRGLGRFSHNRCFGERTLSVSMCYPLSNRSLLGCLYDLLRLTVS
jgi:hypothetical protein